ncbi:MAG: hypothetical protein IJ511_07360 [Bacteroides sp.]|nr:hypothetical protein [Bacteroides sp.]
MKKLVLMAAAIVAVSFASCGGNKANNAEAEAADTLEVAAEEAVEVVNDTLTADTVAVDSAAVVAE